MSDDRANALLKMVDAVRGLLGEIEASGVEGDADHGELIATLSALLEEGAAPAAPAAAGSATATATATAESGEAASGAAAPGDAASGDAASGEAASDEAAPADPVSEEPAAGEAGDEAHPDEQADPVATPAEPAVAEATAGATAVVTASRTATKPAAAAAAASPPIGEVLVKAGATTKDAVAIARMEQGLGDGRPLGSILVEHGQTTPAAVETALEAQSAHRSVVDSSVRVDVELLDSLMRLVGELVLARNQLVSRLDDAQESTKDSSKDSSLARSAQRLSLVTSELQEQVMKTRMQPVDSVWSKMPRVVRDLAKTCGRLVRLEMDGRETELDRSVLEAIKDPLTHLVRNAVDHGIEPPEDRKLGRQAGRGRAAAAGLPRGRPGPPRDHRRRRRHRPAEDRGEGARAGPHLAGPARHDDRTGRSCT